MDSLVVAYVRAVRSSGTDIRLPLERTALT